MTKLNIQFENSVGETFRIITRTPAHYTLLVAHSLKIGQKPKPNPYITDIITEDFVPGSAEFDCAMADLIDSIIKGADIKIIVKAA